MFHKKERRTEFPQKCLACEKVMSTGDREYAESTIGAPDFVFARCGNCGSLVGEMADRSALYQDRDSTNYAEKEISLLHRLKEIFMRLDYRQFLGSIQSSDLVVDYGCGSGELSNMLDSVGLKNIVAIDLQPLRPRNLSPHVQYIPLSKVESLPAKLVFARHVWEHIENPAAALADLRNIITQECSVVIEVPNADSLFRKLMRRRWPGYFAPFHTIIFSKRGLQILVERNGYQVDYIGKKESPILGFFFARLGVPKPIARLVSAALFPLQKLISTVARSGEAIIVVIRSVDSAE